MARPTVIRNEVILEAARAVFLERGVLATSSEVAQRAGVSEGSIFKRFKTKAELFRAAMGLDLEDVPAEVRSLQARVGEGNVEDNLIRVGLDAVGYFERILPIIMMSWSNPKLNDCLPFPSDTEPPPIKIQRMIAEYLEQEQRMGRVGEIQPVVVARAFMGAISSYVFSELFIQNRGLLPIDRSAYIASYVRTLWGGMQPAAAAAAPRSAPRRAMG